MKIEKALKEIILLVFSLMEPNVISGHIIASVLVINHHVDKQTLIAISLVKIVKMRFIQF